MIYWSGPGWYTRFPEEKTWTRVPDSLLSEWYALSRAGEVFLRHFARPPKGALVIYEPEF